MPNLQRRSSVNPDHPVDTCQGAVIFLTGAEPLGALWELCGSEVEGAAMGGGGGGLIRDSITNEDPPNAHQAQHRPVQATSAMSV